VTGTPAASGAEDRATASPAEPPWWSLANVVTLLRVALVPVIAWLLFAGGSAAAWWAFGVFCFAALTDTVDGLLARRMIGVSRWGQVADPAADKLLVIGTLAILAVRDDVSWWVLAVIVVREVAVTVQRQVLLGRGAAMPASLFGKVKTVTQLVAIGALLLPVAPPVLGQTLLLVAVVATVASGLEYAVRAGSRR
jgi:CDP-diacylglycerol--glycerol-3-phosphate 3-phosphatidyltransferase